MSSVPKIFVFKPKLREDIARRKQIAENTGRKVCRRAIYQLINPHRKAVRLATSWFDALRITTNFKLFVHVSLNCTVSETIQRGTYSYSRANNIFAHESTRKSPNSISGWVWHNKPYVRRHAKRKCSLY